MTKTFKLIKNNMAATPVNEFSEMDRPGMASRSHSHTHPCAHPHIHTHTNTHTHITNPPSLSFFNVLCVEKNIKMSDNGQRRKEKDYSVFTFDSDEKKNLGKKELE